MSNADLPKLRLDHPCIGCAYFDEAPGEWYAICRWTVQPPTYACWSSLAIFHPAQADTHKASRFVSRDMPYHPDGYQFPRCPQRAEAK